MKNYIGLNFNFLRVAILSLIIVVLAGCKLGSSEGSSDGSSGGSITATISSSVSDGTTITPIAFTVTFSASVTGLETTDFVVTNGSASSVSGSGTSWTVNVTPSTWGAVTVTLLSGAVSDSDSKTNSVSNTYSVTYGSTLSDDVFAIDVSSNGYYSYYLNREGSAWGTNCSVAETDPNEDVTCTMDVNEGDIYFYGFDIAFQAPAGMCNYVTFSNYHYYNWETGYGPSSVVINLDKDTPASTYCEVDGVLSAANCTDFSTNEEVTNINMEDGTVTCQYDHSVNGSVDNRPNCCMGSYTLTKITTDGSTTTTETEDRSWGGDWGSCLAGPAADDSGWPKTVDGYPYSNLIYGATNGLSETYSIQPSFVVWKNGGNFSSVNFYSDGSGEHTHTGFVNPRSTDLPYAIDPVDDRSGSTMPILHDAYTFGCYDQAWELKHRIRLEVREWNTYAEWLAHGASDGSGGNDPDVTGTEDGVNCDYFNNGSSCNDVWDWDDFLTDVSYPDTSGATSNRANWFPSETGPP